MPQQKVTQYFYICFAKHLSGSFFDQGNSLLSSSFNNPNMKITCRKQHSVIHGRKTQLIVLGSPDGVAASAAVYSIVETAKANNINPYESLRYIFKYLPGVRFKEELKLLENFVPWSLDVQAFYNKAEK